MKRVPTMIGSVFSCRTCDPDDPLKSPDVAKLLKGGLRPMDGGAKE
jgi:hypothetical protein